MIQFPCIHPCSRAKAWLDELITGHPRRFEENLGMAKHVFLQLSVELQMFHGLRDSKWITANEKLAMFLYMARTGCSTRVLQERFQHSGSTISVYIHVVLDCLTGSFYSKQVHLPPDSTPPEVKETGKFYPYFRNARGAIDGSHFHAWVLSRDMARYRNRKGFIGQNVLAACNFALLFVYVLSGWEGSASDSQVFNYARRFDFGVPAGKYYLADAGFPLCDVLMVPYRGIRYHLKEWGNARQRPRNFKELFNLRHAQLRNAVERIFGILKRRWAMFSRAPEYPAETQAQFVAAICALHNFIRVHDKDDQAEYDDDNPTRTSATRNGQPCRRESSLQDLVDNEPPEITPEQLGFSITNEERQRASARRDAIAQEMWTGYKAYMLSKGIEIEEEALPHDA
ncbi:putative nuclease HARBI1-like protein [Mycena kentingensis (nom. inval.)]|nr:putative nuclease HARBI1-like protein [Mycena kentingensis (nom. inval.)]